MIGVFMFLAIVGLLIGVWSFVARAEENANKHDCEDWRSYDDRQEYYFCWMCNKPLMWPGVDNGYNENTD